jgi:altronate dehydratase small subunit
MINALIIDEKDDVAVAIEPIEIGAKVSYVVKDGTVKILTALDNITIYHKIAVKGVEKGSPITKYGEHIGVAETDIKVGMHVHEHNVGSVREKL